jgi:hypothetical protein
MGRVAHRVNTAGVDPAVIEIEQGTNGNGVVNRLVAEAGVMENRDVGGLDGRGLFIDLSHKTEERFLGIRERAGFEILQHTRHQFVIVQQFGRDRGVRLRSKRALIELRGVGGNQLPNTRG